MLFKFNFFTSFFVYKFNFNNSSKNFKVVEGFEPSYSTLQIKVITNITTFIAYLVSMLKFFFTSIFSIFSFYGILTHFFSAQQGRIILLSAISFQHSHMRDAKETFFSSPTIGLS